MKGSFEEMKNAEVQAMHVESFEMAMFLCTLQMKAYLEWLKSNKKVKDEKEQGGRKRCSHEGSKMWLPKGVVDLMQILHMEKLNLGDKMWKPLKKKNKSKTKSRSKAKKLVE